MARRARAWLRTINGGTALSGIREDLGSDGWGLGLDVDWSTLFVSAANRLTTTHSSSPGSGSPTPPPPPTRPPPRYRAHLATYGGANQSGLVDTARNDGSHPGDADASVDFTRALAVNPDWTSVVVSQLQRVTVLAPYAYTRFCQIIPSTNAFNSVEGVNTQYVPVGTETAIFFGGIPAEWSPDGIGSGPYTNAVVPETGAYDLYYDSQHIWVPGGGFSVPCTMTVRIKAGGVTVLTGTHTIVSRPYGPTTAGGVGYGGVMAAAHGSTDGVHLTQGATLSWTLETISSGASAPGMYVLSDNNSALHIQGVGS